MHETSGNVTIRALQASDWRLLRDLRLHALREAEWTALANGDDRHQVFGLSEGDVLVGLTAVFTHRGDHTGSTALFAMSYIAPDHRGRGLSTLLYETRLAWVRAKPQFTKVEVFNRRSNLPARRANQRHGFVEVKAVSKKWPDGSIEDEVVYELFLNG